MIEQLKNIIIYTIYIVVGGVGMILFKLVMSEKPLAGRNLFEILFNPKFIVGILLYGCSFLMFLVILSRFKLNIAYPLTTSLFFIFISLASYFVLKETFSIQHILGIALCLFGIILIGIK
jgi:multidrug transporter EmrE-like cation transporter